MNYSDYRFTLDVQIHQAQVSVPVTFGDSARRLCIGLTDGRKPYVIAEGCRAVFNAKKPDGNVIKNDCIIERNVILYEFTEQTTNAEGIVNCDITLYDADGKVLSSPQFIIVVDKRVVRDEEIAVSEDEYTALDNIFIRETARVNAEALRVEAENSRVDAETLRIDAESDRADAELTRIANENQRVNAESLRADAEIARNLAETARANAEELRANAESQRMSDFEAGQTFRSGEYERAEAQRQSDFEAAEFGRNESEMQRDGAELNRANAELTRISNETERQNKEAERQSNEVIRQKAEVERGKLYTAAEAERDRLYGVAEDARDSEFNTKETARQTAFTKEQSDRAAAWNTEYASREAQLNTFVGGLGIAQTPGDSENMVMSQKAATEYFTAIKSKNLMNLTFENALINSSTGVYQVITPDWGASRYGYSNAASPNFIKVTPETDYMLSWKARTALSYTYVHFYNESKGYISNVATNTHNRTSFKVTTPTECRYIAISHYVANTPWEETLLEEFQIELGDTATSYVSPEVKTLLPSLLPPEAINNYVTPRMFGAVCDGATDDSAALQKAINSGKPVLIDETLSLANTVNVPDYGTITIERNASVLIANNVDAFIIGKYVTIDGFGKIQVTIPTYTQTCITFNGAKYSVVKDISICGYDHQAQDGIGIAILSTETSTSCYNRVDGVSVQSLELGVLMRGAITEDGVTYKWNNSHYIDIHSSFCANAVHVLSCNHNRIDVFGESGHLKVSTRAKYPCVYDTEIYLNNSMHNRIVNKLVDTGNPENNKHVVQYDNGSSFNSVEGIVFDDMVFDQSSRNYLFRRYEVKNMPIAGINSILDDPSVTKTYEAFGTATFLKKGLFQYPLTTLDRNLSYRIDSATDVDNWNTHGVSLECDFNNDGAVSPNHLVINCPLSQSPYRVGIVVSGTLDGEEYSQEVIIPYGIIYNRIVDLCEYFEYDRVTFCKKIKFVFYGCYDFNLGIPTTVTVINSIALSHNEGAVNASLDGFSGIRKTGGTMFGDLAFANGAGMILTADNGTKYRLTVDSDGKLSVTAI